jgi:succinylarginine dihydrolase
MADADLTDPALITEVRVALDELTSILKLGSVYPFQL